MIIIILYKISTTNGYMFKLIQYFSYINLFNFKLCDLLVRCTSKYTSSLIINTFGNNTMHVCHVYNSLMYNKGNISHERSDLL